VIIRVIAGAFDDVRRARVTRATEDEKHSEKKRPEPTHPPHLSTGVREMRA
jgi:hypothetical protein